MSIDISVDQTAIRPGECVTFHWRVQGVKAVYFYREGERWQDHGVVGEERRQACPTHNTTYCLRVVKADSSVEIRQIPIQVMPAGPVTVIDFTVDRTSIRSGECVTFHWRVENVKAVYFFREDQRWQKHGVVREERRQECPPQSTTYYLRVVKGDDGVEVRQIPIQVQPSVATPDIKRFRVEPPDQISVGQCVDIRWKVTGEVTRVRLNRRGKALWDNAPVKGNMQDCPGKPGNIAYVLEATGPGGTTQVQHVIHVVDRPAPPQPHPPEPSPPQGKPVIHDFAVSPPQIKLGASVTINWRCGGATSWVTVVRGEHIVQENAPLSGSAQDRPDSPGEVGYRIVAFNPEDERVRQDRTVKVMP